jgi:aspartate kinase
MKVFKFGGASVKDASSIRNVASIIQTFASERLVIVVSAMGKTTNAIEKIAAMAYNGDDYRPALDELKEYHHSVCEALQLEGITEKLFLQLSAHLINFKDLPFDQYYDQTVIFGELLSTTIVAHYLEQQSIPVNWVNAGSMITTDKTWREANVDMEATKVAVRSALLPILEHQHVITQGFIGKYSPAFYTTLGREGSDYTGAILANCLEAEGLWIWKDVPGVLTADPKEFQPTALIEELSYYEAIEMTYYGATVIHPKTIQPLRTANIPLYVRSFEFPEKPGSVIRMDSIKENYPPILVLKKTQVLLSVSTRDFSFMGEEHMSHIYRIFAENRVKINLMQTAAISISLVVDDNQSKLKNLLEELRKRFHVLSNSQLQLLTVRHYTDAIIEELTGDRDVLLTQKSRQTIQMVLKQRQDYL